MNILRSLLALFCGLLLTIALFTAGIVITINMTVLNPDFVVKEIDKLDIYNAITERINSELETQELYGFSEVIPLDTMIEDVLQDTRPWFEEQTRTVIHKGIAYIKGNEELNITISLQPLKSAIEEQLDEQMGDILPTEMEEIPVDLDVPSLLDMTGMPDNYIISESTLDPDIVRSLQMVKRAVAYLKTAYILSLGIAILTIIGIAWAKRWHIRFVARSLGTPFIISGIACTMLALVIRISNAISSRLTQNIDMSFDFQNNITSIFADITLPLLIYGIVIMVIGIALVIFAFVYPQSSNQTLAQ